MSFSKKVQEARMSYTFDDFLLTPNASYVEPDLFLRFQEFDVIIRQRERIMHIVA